MIAGAIILAVLAVLVAAVASGAAVAVALWHASLDDDDNQF